MNLRFFEPEFNKKVANIFLLNALNSHKIITVLRLPIGAIIYIFNNTNVEFKAKIIALKIFKTNKREPLVEVEILQEAIKSLESPIKIHLAQAVLKNDNMDWIIQKAVELGVEQITPIVTERTIVKLTSNQLINKILHWQSIAINASCQCGRNIVPKINTSLAFDKIIHMDTTTSINKYICSPYKENNLCSKDIRDYQLNVYKNLNQPKEFLLIIGPEGGFSNKELELAQKNQFLWVTMGPRVLRAETAAIVAVSLLQLQYGDLLC